MIKTIWDIIKNYQFWAIVCNEWGDSGKGKVSDACSEQADVVARGTGGNNAGHTVVTNGKKRVFHILPAGIIYDKATILGNGMVIDMGVLCSELDDLDKENISYDKLMISKDAQVIMPYHIIRDINQNVSQENGGIGSTGTGNGPCYSDKANGIGIQISDLFDKDTLVNKIEKAKEFYPEVDINTDKIIVDLIYNALDIKEFVRDTDKEINNFAKQGKQILLEGAQGLLLSNIYGTIPYVTSSDCSYIGTAKGVGLEPEQIDFVLGLAKFNYTTRVGAGPFPTEFGGNYSERYCAIPDVHMEKEFKDLQIDFKKINGKITYDPHQPKILELLNSHMSFMQGRGVRVAAEEYGATTGRLRRTGWKDLNLLKHAVKINGPNLGLTKADVLRLVKEIKVAVSYSKDVNFTKAEELYQIKPNDIRYKHFTGSDVDISGIKDYNDLPEGDLKYVKFIEDFTGGRVVLISNGAEKEQMIIR